MRNAKITVLAAIGMMMFFIAGNEALAQQIGVVGLYKADKGAATNINERMITDLSCQLRRAGAVVGENGNINIEKPNRFVFIACDNSLLRHPAKRRVLNGLISNAKALAVLEGALTDNSGEKSKSAAKARQYILKISHYNNRDTDGREQDLDRIMRAVKPSADRFINESVIAVNRSLGMPTPDEVVILFYGYPEQGDRFRKNNPDILQDIGAFNKAHLNDYIYYVGAIAE